MMKKILEEKQIYIVILVIIFIAMNSYHSNVLAAKADRTPPTVPTNLRAVTISDLSVSLTWNASYDKVGVISYNIYKNNVLIDNTSATTFTANGLTPLTSYQFSVKAKDTAGNFSSSSNILTIKTLSAATAPAPTPIITVSPTPTPTVTLAPTPTVTPTPGIPQKRLVGYYAAWAAYSGFYPDMVEGNKLTHINYAFANIGSDLKLTLGYPDVDLINFSKLNELKKSNPALKTIISVGGWSWSGRFSDVALTDTSRTIFADSCVDFITKYGFDGVDIDWEYPVSGGLATNVWRTTDKQNFTLLMQKIREKLDARGVADGKHYILTFAGAGSYSYINNTELNLLKQYVDYGNIMTYDIHGTWDTYTDFNAPLYSNTDNSPQYKWSVDESVNLWLKAGFPADKIVMGVPFYGYVYSLVPNQNNGLYQTYGGSSSISYGNIAGSYLNNPAYVRYFHTQSKVPWLFNGSVFISYEDEQSISYKAQYIKSKSLGGAMVWELSQDPNRILLNSLYNGLQ